MGCPVFEKQDVVLERPIDYPFEPLYRPWSWVLSTIVNVTILAVLFLIAYSIVKRVRKRRSKDAVDSFAYRRLEVRASGDSGKVPVLVTGANGSLGRKLVDALLQDGGYAVHCLDLFIPNEDGRNPEAYSHIAADVTDLDNLAIAIREARVKVVFHAAGLIPRAGLKHSDHYRVNEQGTKNIIECCQQCGVERLIYTSTCDVLMSSDKDQVLDFADETTPLPTQPLNAYCGSKLNGEKAVLKANNPNMQTCILRCSTIATADTSICHALLTTQPTYVGDGKNKMTFVPSGACARAHILAEKKLRDGASSVAAGQVYNICGDDCFEVQELMGYKVSAEADTTVWGYPPPKSVPRWLAAFTALFNHWVCLLTGYAPFSYQVDNMSIDFITRSYTFNNAKAHRDLGWEELPTWKETVQEIIKEYQHRQESKKDL